MKAKLDIVIAVPGMRLYPGVFEKESVGGSETAGYMMARALARRGHSVYLFCNIDKAVEDDLKVHFFPISMFLEHAGNIPHDVCVVQRMPELFYKRTESRLNVLWMHDLPLGRQTSTVRGAIWNVDGMFLLSDFHAKRYKEVYDLKDETIWRSRNGIDLDLVAASYGGKRERAILYAARPERGLENLLEMMPEILKRVPDAKLKLCTYANEAEQLAAYYMKINALCAKLEPAVEFLGHLTKTQLYDVMKACRVYAYPVPAKQFEGFAEISCIAAMEAQACGLPIVATNHGALPETVNRDAGILIDGLPWEEKPRQEFVDNIVSLLTDDSQVEYMAHAGQMHAAGMGWASVAEEWEQKFFAEIRARNQNVDRLVRHFWRNSDILAARQLVEENRDHSAADEWRGMLESQNDAKPVIKEPAAPLSEILAKFIKGHAAEIKSVYDFAGGIGAKGREAILKAVEGVTIQDDPAPAEVDIAVAQSVLELYADPRSVVEDIESKVRAGGFVYITVPFGPGEFGGFDTGEHRERLWNFDKHDVRDLFGKKKEITIHAIMTGRSPELDCSTGWWVVSYRAGPEELGSINMRRKLWLQRPRQTLSACIMAGGSAVEETVHWMIRPLRHIVDEIIVADAGLTAEGRRIIEQYPVTIVPSVDPKTEGFETPRNHALEKARMDWILWIDTDERFLEPEKIDKYLRQNELNGYGVQQHHLNVDGARWMPDLPVRLFRNGRGIRFYGMIHEHPELALNEGPGISIVAGDLHIAHLGYMIESVRKGRFNRNWPMLEADRKKYPTRELQKNFVIRDTMLLVQKALQRSNGVLTDAMKEKLEEVIKLFRDNFLEKPIISKNLDVIEYYSTAVGMLGRGFEVVFSLDAAKDVVRDQPDETRIRFDTEDDCVKFMAARVKQKIAPFVSKDF